MHEMEQLQKFKDFVSTLHVTKDLRERGIKILMLIENSKQSQMILHCGEESRRDRPDYKKANLTGSSLSKKNFHQFSNDFNTSWLLTVSDIHHLHSLTQGKSLYMGCQQSDNRL